MIHYHPTINPRAYSLARLQARRNVLAHIGQHGNKHEKASRHRRAELARIEADLKRRASSSIPC